MKVRVKVKVRVRVRVRAWVWVRVRVRVWIILLMRAVQGRHPRGDFSEARHLPPQVEVKVGIT